MFKTSLESGALYPLSFIAVLITFLNSSTKAGEISCSIWIAIGHQTLVGWTELMNCSLVTSLQAIAPALIFVRVGLGVSIVSQDLRDSLFGTNESGGTGNVTGTVLDIRPMSRTTIA
jgi:hypothetical protein